jgi:hypothetical protein
MAAPVISPEGEVIPCRLNPIHSDPESKDKESN